MELFLDFLVRVAAKVVGDQISDAIRKHLNNKG